MPKLVITDDDGVREAALHDGDTLGRVASNAIQLSIAEASRVHCRFTHEKGSWFLEDLESSNGTLLNGRRTLKAELQDGDVIEIGAVSLRFLDVEEEPGFEEPDDDWGTDELSLEESHCLVLLGGGREGEVVPLPEGEVTLGRQARHMIQVLDGSVSGAHAALVREGDRVQLRDTSSNGTFVNGEKIAEAELRDGDEIRFGAVPALYRVGSLDEIRSESAAVATTRMMGTVEGPAEEGAYEDEWDESLDADAVSGGGGRWTLILVVLIVAAFVGALFYLTQGPLAGGPAEKPRRTVQDPEWSFEEPAEGASDPWVRDGEQGEGAGASEARIGEARSGESGLLVQVSAASPLSAWRFAEERSVQAGDVLDLSVHALTLEPGAAPWLGVRWLRRADRGREETEEPAVLRAALDAFPAPPASEEEWQERRGLFVAPAWARSAQILVGATGEGEVVLDDAAVTGVGGEKGFLYAKHSLTTTPAGAVHLGSEAYGRAISFLGLVPEGEEAPGAFAATGGNARSRESAGYRVEVGEVDALPFVHFEGSALAAAAGILIRVAPDRVAAGTAVFEGERGRAASLDADGALVEGVGFGAAGPGGDPVHLHFFADAEAQQPVKRRVRAVGGPGSGRYLVETAGASALHVRVQPIFSAEVARAEELIEGAKGRSPRREVERLEGAIALLPLHAGEPIAGARRRRAELLEQGATLVETLRESVEDRLYCRDVLDAQGLRERLAQERRRWSGTPSEADFEALANRLDAAAAEVRAEMRAVEVERLLARATDYKARGRERLARHLLEDLRRRHPGSEGARKAEEMLKTFGEPEKRAPGGEGE
jgi:pSer/pThr/pTyr-binding forkhead associated (FHA) protein